MKIGYLRTDDSSHNYIVPESEIAKFDKVNSKIEGAEEESQIRHYLTDLFNKFFGEYRVDDISGMKILMEE